MTLLIGLTGNIASGKSTVGRMLVARGAVLIDADELSRAAVRAGTSAYRAIVEHWGPEVVNPDGSLDRAALRARVFSDPAELERLNSIVHPEVARMRDAGVEQARSRGEQIIVCDIPLLFEKHLTEQFPFILLVDAPRPLRLERLVRDRGLTEADAMQMIAAQMPAELKRARADIVIDNAGTKEELERRVDEVWSRLLLEESRQEQASTGVA